MDGETPASDFVAAFSEHRTKLLRHCYRMLGSFADAEDMVQETLLRAWRARGTFSAGAPLANWLMRIATNACLTHLNRRGPRHLPQFERVAADPSAPFESLEAAYWVTPAPDAELFQGPQEALEARENVALAFVALLQRLPPSQRAALLLKDVIGWSADEIARTLTMPPFANWFRGVEAVRKFVQSQRFAPFWTRGLAARGTRANGRPALVWYTPRSDGLWQPHSIHVMQFDGSYLKDAINFIGAPYLAGFQLPAELPRDRVGG